MPSDMAMKRPDTRVILIDLEDYVGGCVGIFSCLYPNGVSALGVGGVGDGVVVFAEAFGEDVPFADVSGLEEGGERGREKAYML